MSATKVYFLGMLQQTTTSSSYVSMPCVIIYVVSLHNYEINWNNILNKILKFYSPGIQLAINPAVKMKHNFGFLEIYIFF